jgi:hypothetical protein
MLELTTDEKEVKTIKKQIKALTWKTDEEATE